MATWLVETFSLTTEDARADGNRPLGRSCEYGHLEVAQWLITRFNLTVEDARAANALRYACDNGHLGVATWLIATFGSTACISAIDELINACDRGNFDVVKWLVKTFNHFTEYMHYNGDWVLLRALRNSHPEIAERIAETFGLVA